MRRKPIKVKVLAHGNQINFVGFRPAAAKYF
jgi:hypothetical protein